MPSGGRWCERADWSLHAPPFGDVRERVLGIAMALPTLDGQAVVSDAQWSLWSRLAHPGLH